MSCRSPHQVCFREEQRFSPYILFLLSHVAAQSTLQPNASASSPSGNANAYYPTVGMRPSPTPAQQHTPSSYSNGPSTSSTSNEDAAQQNFPMLRVQVAEQYRTMPPVSMPWHLLSIPSQDHDFLCKYPFSPCTYAALFSSDICTQAELLTI